MTQAPDPVLQRRATLARWVKIGQRTGYVALLAGFIAFVVGFSRGFTPGMVVVVEVLMVIASVLLIPTIVLSHGIRAAVKEEYGQGIAGRIDPVEDEPESPEPESPGPESPGPESPGSDPTSNDR